MLKDWVLAHLGTILLFMLPFLAVALGHEAHDWLHRRRHGLTVWIAREPDGNWMAFANKPARQEATWGGIYLGSVGWMATPEILRMTWDSEPVKLRIRSEVVEG